jgi:LPXTG-motif cell wall-anchored protein
MRRYLPFVLALVLAPSAHAKGITGMQVCGQHRCIDMTGQADERFLGVAEADGPRRPEPFVVFNAEMSAPGEPDMAGFTMRFLPKAGLFRAEDGGWYEPRPGAVAALRRAAGHLSPFPASRLDRPAPELTAPAPPPPDPRTPAPAPATDDGGMSVLALAGAAALALLAAAAAVSVRRRRAMLG